MRGRIRMGGALAAVAALVITGAAPVGAQRGQTADSVRANYTKFEYRVPMRDGVKLFTSVYVPKDRSRTYPILLNRTPYSVAPYGPDAYKNNLGPSSPRFLRGGYIFVYQDVRGRMMSEGEFVNMRPHLATKAGPAEIDESTDTYDTIEWLLKNVPGHNGRVGMWGISYPGFYASAGMIDAHPALKAVSPQAPITDWFIGDDFHHNGALYLPHAFGFLSSFGKPRPAPTTRSGSRFDFGTQDGYQFYQTLVPLSNANALYLKDEIAFWNEMMAHETYDAFWQARNLRPHLRDIKPAVLTVGGWFDAEDLFGALETYKHVERNSPAATNTVVMGPWSHGGWAGDGDFLGDVRFGSKTGLFFQEQIEFPFFEHHLKDAPDPGLPEAYVFETGRNQWRRMDAWPPAKAAVKALYLAPGGKLSWQLPSEGGAFDEYISDPAKPVPYINHVAIGMTQTHMVDDQRFASRRPDVLTYVTDVLESDVTVAGPITPSLQVSTTGTDSDWVVKLIDVYPDASPAPPPPAGDPFEGRGASRMGGYQQLVRGEVMRGKFRTSYEKPEPFEPGQVTRVEYVMPDVFHTFRAGHRIMVQIQSSWFPLVDLNPQTFVNIPNASASDFKKATQRVYRGRDAASHVQLTILEGF